jgi:hypothetical protein
MDLPVFLSQMRSGKSCPLHDKNERKLQNKMEMIECDCRAQLG